jgi:hypothetical protein
MESSSFTLVHLGALNNALDPMIACVYSNSIPLIFAYSLKILVARGAGSAWKQSMDMPD